MARKEAIFTMKVDSDDAVKDVRKLDQDMTHLADTIGVEVSGSISAMEDKLYDLALAGKQNTKEFRDLQAQTAKYKQIIIETDRSIDQLAEQGRGLSTALSLAEGTVAGFQAFTGVTAILGDENEELLETITKLQAAQGALNGIMIIREQLQKNAIKLTQAQAAIQRALNVAIGNGTKGMQLFRKALIATGIGALIAAIGTLIAYWDELSDAISGTTDKQRLQNDVANKAVELASKELNALDKLSVAINDETRSRDDKNKAVQDLQKEYPHLLNNIDAENVSLDDLNKAIELNSQLVMLNAQMKAIATLREEEMTKKIQEQVDAQTGQNESWYDGVTSMFAYTNGLGDIVNEETLATNRTKEATEAIDEKIGALDSLEKSTQDQIKALREQAGLTEDTTEADKKAAEDAKKKEAAEKAAFEKRKARIIAEMEEEARLRRDSDAFIKELEERLQAESDTEVEFQKEHLKRMQSLTDEIGGDIDKELEVEEAKQDAARETERIKREEAEKTRAMQVANADAALQMTSDSLGAIGQLYSSLAGESEAAQRKVFNVNKAVSIAQAIVSTAQGIMAQLAVPQDALTGANFVKAGIVATTGAAQIATIARTKFNSGGGGGGGSTPSLQGATAGSFSANQNTNNQNTTDLNPDGSVNNGMNDGIKVIVTETDITKVQNKVAKTQALATF